MVAPLTKQSGSQSAVAISDEGRVMELRSHPSMSYRGFRTWPPVWIREFGPETYPAGEAGILEDVLPSIFDNECYLVIEHYGSRYRGLVHCDNAQFFSRLYRYLRDICGHPIREIGEIEVDNLHAV